MWLTADAHIKILHFPTRDQFFVRVQFCQTRDTTKQRYFIVESRTVQLF